MDGGAWKAAVHGVAEGRTRLSDFTFTFHFHALEEEMATHSSVLAWRIPGTGELGGLPSMWSRKVGHDWSDLASKCDYDLKYFLDRKITGKKDSNGVGGFPGGPVVKDPTANAVDIGLIPGLEWSHMQKGN